MTYRQFSCVALAAYMCALAFFVAVGSCFLGCTAELGGSSNKSSVVVADAGVDSVGAGTDVSVADAGIQPDVCTPQCSGKFCGDDGCGGQCGICGSGKECVVGGKCQPVSIPKLDAGTPDAGSVVEVNVVPDAGSVVDAGNGLIDCPTCKGDVLCTCWDDGSRFICHKYVAGKCEADGSFECATVNGAFDKPTVCQGATKCSEDGWILFSEFKGCVGVPVADAGSTDAGKAEVDAGSQPEVQPTPTCDDSDPCTQNVYKDGVCWHPSINCDDGKANTVDTCDKGVCVHTPLPQPQPVGTRMVCVTTVDNTIIGVVGDEWTSSTQHSNWGSFEQVAVYSGKKWCRTVTDPAVKAVGFLLIDQNGEMYPGWQGTLGNIIFSAAVEVKASNDAGVIYDDEMVGAQSTKQWLCEGNNPLSSAGYGICFWNAGNGKDYRMMVPLYCTEFGSSGC